MGRYDGRNSEEMQMNKDAYETWADAQYDEMKDAIAEKQYDEMKELIVVEKRWEEMEDE